MTRYHHELAALRAALTELYPDEASARRVCGDAGLDPYRIAFSPRAVDTWNAILAEAQKQAAVPELIAVAQAEYPRYQPLADAATVYLQATAARQPPAHTGVHFPTSPIAFEWVEIPASEFIMGSDPMQDALTTGNETPQHRVFLATFWIARVPVTVAQFALFVDATGYKTTAEVQGSGYTWAGAALKDVPGASWRAPRGPDSGVAGKTNHPVTCVSWWDAQAFCRWAGVRLPTETEWEKAARGIDGRIFPWGDQGPDKRRCNFNANVGDTTPVGSYPAGASPYGVLDMSGNVWEWCQTKWSSDYTAGADNTLQGEVTRVVRGGSYVNEESAVRCAVRGHSGASYRYEFDGFRVATAA